MLQGIHSSKLAFNSSKFLSMVQHHIESTDWTLENHAHVDHILLTFVENVEIWSKLVLRFKWRSILPPKRAQPNHSVNPNNVNSIEMYYNTATKLDMNINYFEIKISGNSPEIQSRDQHNWMFCCRLGPQMMSTEKVRKKLRNRIAFCLIWLVKRKHCRYRNIFNYKQQ